MISLGFREMVQNKLYQSVAGRFRLIALRDHPGGSQRHSNRTCRAVGMGMGHFARCFCFIDYALNVVCEVGPDGRGAHGASIAERSLAIKGPSSGLLPWDARVYFLQNDTRSVTITAPRITDILAGERRG